MGKEPRGAEDEAERRPSTPPGRAPRWAPRDPRRRLSSSGSAAGRDSTKTRRRRRDAGRGGETEGHARPPESPPREGERRGGAGARSGPGPGEPARRSRAPALRGVGEGGRPSQRGRAGRSSNCLLPGSLPRPRWPAAGRPEGLRWPGQDLTYTVKELVAPRVQFLPKAASLNGALLPPTHPRHLLPPARPSLRRGPAHAQPRRPGPRTHPRPGRRTSRRGRRGGRAGLTSRWPRRGPGDDLGAHPPGARRGAAAGAVPASSAVAAAAGRPGRRLPAAAAQSRRPPHRRRALPRGHGGPCLSLPEAFCFLNQTHLSLLSCLSPGTNCCKFRGNWFSELLGRNCSSHEPV